MKAPPHSTNISERPKLKRVVCDWPDVAMWYLSSRPSFAVLPSLNTKDCICFVTPYAVSYMYSTAIPLLYLTALA